MIGYILAIALLVYFFLIWPCYDNLPPQTERTKRQRIAGRLGLHDKPSFGRIYLTKKQREDLIQDVIFTDNATFSAIAKADKFFLVESRKSELSIYCSTGVIDEPDSFEMLQDKKLFVRLNIEEKVLIRFLQEIQPLKKVELNE